MPDRIISPPMVGVPCFSTMWRCGPSLRIGWPLPCFTLSKRDDARTEEEDEEQCRQDRRTGPRRLVLEDVEQRHFVGETGEQVEEHQDSFRTGGNFCRMASTSGPIRLPSDPLTITTSPTLRPPQDGFGDCG